MKQFVVLFIVVFTLISGNFTVSAHTLSAENRLHTLDGEWVFYHKEMMTKGTFEQGKVCTHTELFSKIS